MSTFLRILSVCVLALAAVSARAEIGTVQFAIGDVRLTTAQGTRAIAKGALVNEGDTLIVGSGSAQIKMVDGGYLAVRPDTQMKFDQYKWAGKEDGSERGLLSLVRGGFRSITGALGRINKENFKINTPTATVGIRGTDHEIIYIPPGTVSLAPMPAILAQAGLQLDVAPLLIGQQETLVPMLLAAAAPPGGGQGGGVSSFANTTIVKNNVGVSTIQQRVGGVPIGIPLPVSPNQIAVARVGQAPSILPPGVGTNLVRATPPPGSKPPAPAGGAAGQQGGQQGGAQGQQQQGTAQSQQQQQGAAQSQQQQGQGAAPAQAGESTATAPAPAQQQAAPPAQQQAEPLRASVVDSPTQVATASQTATQSAVTSPVATTTVVTVSPVSTGGGSSSSSSSTSTTTATTTPIVLTSSSGLTVNTTSNTVTSSGGTAAPISQGAFASQADTAAAAATAAANALNTLLGTAGGLELLPLTSEVSSASALVTPAQTAFNAANALTINTATPTATAASAASTTAAANATYTANGAFADATLATPAKNAMTTANTTLQSAASTITSLATTLGSDKTSGGSTLTSVGAALTAANNALTTLTTLATALGVPTTSTAQSLLSTAQNAATLAGNAAAQALVFQNAGNFTHAELELTFAQQQQTIAVKALAAASAIISGIASAQAAGAGAGVPTDTTSSAGTVYGYANDAQAVAAAAANAATTVTTQAAIVAAKAPIAQYSNPAFASPSNGFVHTGLAMKAVTGGFQTVFTDSFFDNLSDPVSTNFSGNNYVLDANKNLVELRTSTAVAGNQRYVKYAGGTAQDGFKTSDNSLYMGRWQGGSMNLYTDVGLAGGTSLLESISLGTTSAHWLIGVAPPVNYIPKLIGTSNFAMVASTKPTDSLGNAGVLNSASLTANFSAQTVQAGVNLSIPSRSINIVATTPNVPIMAGDVFYSNSNSVLYPPTINGCAGMSCTGYVGNISGGFTGSTSSGGGFSYGFNPNTAAPYSDLIQGVVAFSATAPTVGGNPTAVGSTGSFRSSIIYPVSISNGEVYLASTTRNALSNTALIRDGAGNLVRVNGDTWNVYNGSAGAASQYTGAVTQCLNSTPSNASTTAIVSMGGGAIPSFGVGFNSNGDKSPTATLTETYADTTNGISFGRYLGGVVNASTVTGTFKDVLTNLGGNSVLWNTREVPASIPVVGVFHYTPTFGTAPVDALGNVGSLNRARLDVNFATQQVNPEVSITMNSQLGLRAWAANVPITSTDFGFNVVSATTNSPINVSCVGTNCAPPPVGSTNTGGYGARIQGGLAGDATANGAFFRYSFFNYYTPGAAVGATGGIPSGTQASTTINNNFINGMVAFNKGPAAAPPATPALVYSTAFYVWPGSSNTTPVALATPFGSNDVFVGNTMEQGSGTVDAQGNLLSVTENEPNNPTPNFIKINTTPTPTPVPATPITTANGITFGRYNGQTVAQAQAGTGNPLTIDGNLGGLGSFGATSSSPTTLAKSVVGALQWIRGPELWPFYVSSILQGTATYPVVNASPATDQNGFSSGLRVGMPGENGTATLGINFDKQSVNVALSNIVVPANAGSQLRTWNATANNVALNGDGRFNASNTGGTNPLADRSLSVTMTTTTCTPLSCVPNSSPQAGFGSLGGALTGSGGSGTSASGAILSYAFAANDVNNVGSHEHVNGVVAFGSPTFTANAAGAGGYGGTSVLATQPYQIRLGTSGSTSGFDATTGVIRSGAISDRAFAISNESLVGIIGEVIDPGSVKYNSANQPVAFDAIGRVVSGSSCSTPGSNCNTNEIPTYVSVSTSALTTAAGFAVPAVPTGASIADFGRDPTTGASWGRYVNGDMVVVDRITGTVLSGGSAFSTGNNRHFIYSGVQSGPTVLPITGTATYTIAGNTNPTDNTSPNTFGTLNSATLAANFTAKTVDVGVNATVSGNTWAASATGVAIQKGVYFEVGRDKGGGSLNLACTNTSGACGGTLSGKIAGGFIGPTGQGAGVAYIFNTSTYTGNNLTTLGQTVAGVVAFKR